MYYVGIDVGGTNLKAGVVDENGHIISKVDCPTKVERGHEAVVADMAKLALRAIEKSGVSMDEVKSIGIGIPGILDPRTGIVPFCTNLGWHNVPLIELMQKDVHKPIYVDNDATVATLAENVAGVSAGAKSSVFLTLGTGVGGGVIVNGKVIDGTHGAGGEIGHITVDRHETAACGCGKHGCLEQYSSATGVVRCMKKLLDENPDTPCTLRGTEFAAKDVFDAARNGDALAAREVDEMTDTLGMALATIAATVDPEMFMVGGGVSRAGDVLFAPLREHFKVYAFKSCRETPIVPAILGNDAGIYGSVRLIVGE